MLAVGNIMNQGTKQGRASGFTLDSLLKMINTKGLLIICVNMLNNTYITMFVHLVTILGIDKKTTVLDYVVGSMYDRLEDDDIFERLINELEDTESASRIGTNKDIRDEIELILRNYSDLEKECSRLESGNSLDQLYPLYKPNLTNYLSKFKDTVDMLRSSRTEMAKRIEDVIQYFGEDIHSCEMSKVFDVLGHFRKALVKNQELYKKQMKLRSQKR
jgi:hypothetical protein